MKLTLTRFCYAPDGTFGLMPVDGVVLYTVERGWLDNAPMISCIPEGTYTCRPRYFFRKEYDAIEVCDVPGRTHILFHKANLPHQLAGCIAPASELGCFGGQWAGLASGIAFGHLMGWLPGEFELTIEQVKP